MGLKATVLIPTSGDRGPLLRLAADSVLAQTIDDLELFIIGDGAADSTRRVVDDLCKRDERVRFFDHPKGVRRGELYRHAALAEARGEIVCYLCDRDLMLPNHVAAMLRLLSNADFANALPLYVDFDGALQVVCVDLRFAADRGRGRRGFDRFGSPDVDLPRFGLSFGAHTLAMYRRLPYGWRTTPENMATDVYMWQQFLSVPDCRAVSATKPTVLSFRSQSRKGRPVEENESELKEWSEKIRTSTGQQEIVLEVLDTVVRDWTKKAWILHATPSRRVYRYLLGKRPFLQRLPGVPQLVNAITRALIGRAALAELETLRSDRK